MSCAADYRVRFKVRNNRLLAAIEQAGYPSLPKFSAASGVSYPVLVKLVAMKQGPLDTRGRWLPTVLRLSRFLGCRPEDLFNEQQRNAPVKSNRREVEMTSSQVHRVLENNRCAFQLAMGKQDQADPQSHSTDSEDDHE